MKNILVLTFLLSYLHSINAQSLVVYERSNALAWIVDYENNSKLEFAGNNGLAGDITGLCVDEGNEIIYISTVESLGDGENAIYGFDYSGAQVSKISTPEDVSIYELVYNSQAEEFYFLNTLFISQLIYSISKDGSTLDTLVESSFLEDIVLDQENSILYATKGGNVLAVDLVQGTEVELLAVSNSQSLIDIAHDQISNSLYVVSDKDPSGSVPVRINNLSIGGDQLEAVLDIGDSRPSAFSFNEKDTLITWTNFLTTDINAIDTNGENQQIIFEPSNFGFSYFEIFALNGAAFIDNFVDAPSSVKYNDYRGFDISISPNPSTGPIQITSSEILINPIVNIYNHSGQLIQSERSIDQKISLPSGQYYIQIIDEKQKLYSLEKIEVIN